MNSFVKVGDYLIPLSQVTSMSLHGRTPRGMSVETVAAPEGIHPDRTATLVEIVPHANPDVIALVYGWDEDGLLLHEQDIIAWRVETKLAEHISGAEIENYSAPVLAGSTFPESGVAIWNRRTGSVQEPFCAFYKSKEDFLDDLEERTQKRMARRAEARP